VVLTSALAGRVGNGVKIMTRFFKVSSGVALVGVGS
jgi:hypothetical protein